MSAPTIDVQAFPEFFDETFLKLFCDVDRWIRDEDKDALLECINNEDKPNPVVNLSGDRVLHVVTAYGKPEFAAKLIKGMSQGQLSLTNKLTGDTALHVAAAMGNETVALQLIESKVAFLDQKNEQNETPLHKAASNGQIGMFLMLERKGAHKVPLTRTKEGNTVLHCAILGNAPRLALHIANKYPELIERRNMDWVTPLHLMVTILKNQRRFSPLDTIICKLLPVEEDDDEISRACLVLCICKPGFGTPNPYELRPLSPNRRFARGQLPKNYEVLFDIWDLAFGIWKFFVKMLRRRYSTIEELCSEKEKRKAYRDLVRVMAGKPEYWEFIESGRNAAQESPTSYVRPDEAQAQAQNNRNSEGATGGKKDHGQSDRKIRWNESPLTLGAKNGLYGFVVQILEICPMSSLVLDPEGHNILQVAIACGEQRIVNLIESMAYGSGNPILSSSWLSSTVGSDRDKRKNNGHFAANLTVDLELARPLQLKNELQWFKRVQKLVPVEKRYSRNSDELTAWELFLGEHKAMLDKAREKLIETGKTYGGLVAAVVFTSSFSIPGENVQGKPQYVNRLAFKIFSHAYVIGLSCASTALVLFLTLINSQYRMEDFESYVPTIYRFATISFFMALVALLVAFACNIYLSIYGGEKVEAEHMIPFICELLALPTIVLLYVLTRGASAIKKYVRDEF